MRIIADLDVARSTILRRGGQPEDSEGGQAAREANRRVWREPLTIAEVVDRILRDVASEGDTALRRIAARVDGFQAEEFAVPVDVVGAARAAVPRKTVHALELAAERIRWFHERHVPRGWEIRDETGVYGQVVTPIERVGLLVPGGRATYPSTVLMLAIPARVCGCREVVVCSPPGPEGRPSPVILAAAAIAGVDRVFALGGAQAVAALAYGTASVPRVDKILGPGNAYVAEAKRRVFGTVGIDQIAGPTETLIIADDSPDPSIVAADVLAQAEHDPMAAAIVIALGENAAAAIAAAIATAIESAPRRSILEASLAHNGGVIVAPSIDVAMDLANAYAPEHLALLVRDPWRYVPLVRHAGGVFVGEPSIEAIGDYVAGPSHVMPTGGTARFSSPITCHDFVKITSLFAIAETGVARLGPAAADLARAEGLENHARAIEARDREKEHVGV